MGNCHVDRQLLSEVEGSRSHWRYQQFALHNPSVIKS